MRTFVVLAATVALTVLAGRAQAGAQTTTETATQFYGRYRGVVAKATNVDEVVALWTTDLVQGYKASPPAERVGLDEMKKIYGTHSNVSVVKEGGTPNYVTLTLEGIGPNQAKAMGTVDVVRENGSWRVSGLEMWK
jgi:hypothetical protein